LAGLRDTDRLKKLPVAEQEACRRFWTDVAAAIDQFSPVP